MQRLVYFLAMPCTHIVEQFNINDENRGEGATDAFPTEFSIQIHYVLDTDEVVRSVNFCFDNNV